MILFITIRSIPYWRQSMKVAIIGAGKLGLTLAEALLGGDSAVTLIDKNAALLQKVGAQYDLLTVTANAKQVSVLQEIRIDTYDLLISVTDTDEKNILICSFAKKLGCPLVIARIRDPEHINQMDFIKDTMDIDYIVNPDMSISNEIYKFLVEKYTFTNGIFTRDKISLIEFKVHKLPVIIGKTNREVAKMLGEMLLVAISRNGKIILPQHSTVIEDTDSLYVIGKTDDITKLNAIVHEDQVYTDLNKVMIVGGGKTGLYLAQKLADYGASVKIIEIDKARSQYLSEHLNNVLVLNGDATDRNLLQEENIDEMDAFIAATGFDEDNLLLALMAKQHHIEDVVAKVSRRNYAEIIESLGIDMALNPSEITASNILRFIQSSDHVVSSQLIQGQAEIIEVNADDKLRILNKPLEKLDLPEGMLIAAIRRGDEVIMPKPVTEIKSGDRVMIFCLLSQIPNLENLLRSGKTGFWR